VFFCPPDSCIHLYTFERVRHRGARWSCSSTHTHVRANLTVFDLCIHRHNAARRDMHCVHWRRQRCTYRPLCKDRA
jgi:hypothetical protein